MTNLTNSQQKLLLDLYALEKQGYIRQTEQVLAYPGYDEGSLETEVGGVLTDQGKKAAETMIKTRHVIKGV